MIPIYGFYHIGTLSYWKDIVSSQIEKLQTSGLYDQTEKIFYSVHGIDYKLDLEKAERIHYRDKLPLDKCQVEYPILNYMREFCKETECLIWYIHTKGNSHPPDLKERMEAWRNYMEYFVIHHHESCQELLYNTNEWQGPPGEGYDAVGTDLSSLPSRHFSGNFWWSKSSYISKLPYLDESVVTPIGCELWIGQGKGTLAGLHHAHTDFYHKIYPELMYIEEDPNILRLQTYTII